jgi:hypothetical protein
MNMFTDRERSIRRITNGVSDILPTFSHNRSQHGDSQRLVWRRPMSDLHGLSNRASPTRRIYDFQQHSRKLYRMPALRSSSLMMANGWHLPDRVGGPMDNYQNAEIFASKFPTSGGRIQISNHGQLSLYPVRGRCPVSRDYKRTLRTRSAYASSAEISVSSIRHWVTVYFRTFVLFFGSIQG